MLPKRSRVRTRKDIERVLRKGRTLSSPFFTLRIIMRPDATGSRFGCIVSNKISKRAVVRNRIKRRLRETFRQYSSYFPPQSDVIVIARQALVNVDSTTLREELLLLLKKYRLL